ncbi:MAG: DUF2267 domain-containing protein [Bacteroidota bacterium]
MKEPPRYQPHFIYLREIIASIASWLGYPNDYDKPLALVKSLFSTICQSFPFSRVVQLFAALPLPLQALTVEQWKIEQFLPDPIHTLSDFLDEIVASDPNLFPANATGKELAQSTLFATMKVISNHVSPDDMQQIIRIFPDDAQERIHTFILLNT